MTNENQVEHRTYEQVNSEIFRNGQRTPEIIKKFDGRIVLLKSFHSMGNFERGRLVYEADSKVCYLEYERNGESSRKRIHLHDIEGLLVENINSK